MIHMSYDNHDFSDIVCISDVVMCYDKLLKKRLDRKLRFFHRKCIYNDV